MNTAAAASAGVAEEKQQQQQQRVGKHVEVCARIRPLVIGKESSNSFFANNNASGTTTAASSSTTASTTSGATKNASTSSSSSSSSSSFNRITTTGGTTPSTSSNNASKNNATANRKPMIPRFFGGGGGSSNNQQQNKSTVSSSSPKNNNTNTNSPSSNQQQQQHLEEHIVAWDVSLPDSVSQSTLTDIIPGRTHSYTLDRVYDSNSTTQQLYNQSIKGLVISAMDGYHTSVLAYGQTSTGKTYTMTGTLHQPGIIPLAVQECFQYVHNYDQIYPNEPREYLLRVSYLEVYKEHIRDLLATSPNSAPPVRLFESGTDGLIIKGLEEKVITNPKQVFTLLEQGEKRRQIGATHFNQHSSRSHVMVRIWIESRSCRSISTSSSSPSMKSGSVAAAAVRVSSLSLVDLAGSESVRLTGSSERREEGHYINKSLMTLGQVVYALSEEAESNHNRSSSSSSSSNKHIPYRDSKLTRLLQPSLSRNAQVVLLCCISPLISHLEESHNTFKFAIRAKKIPQRATIIETTDEKTLLQSYRQEIEDLKQQLKEAQLQQQRLLQRNHHNNNIHDDDVMKDIDALLVDDEEEGELPDDREIQELILSIQTMERLILKSNNPTIQQQLPQAKPEQQLHQQPEDLLDLTDGYEDARDEEEGLMALVSGGGTSNNISFSSPTNNVLLKTPPRPGSIAAAQAAAASVAAANDANSKSLQIELTRIQGLLNSVIKKQRHSNKMVMLNNKANNSNNTSSSSPSSTTETTSSSATATTDEVRNLRAQLEQQEVTTSLRKADSSFLQLQLEEKDKLLVEVSKVLEAMEERHAALEAENNALRDLIAHMQQQEI